MILKQTGTAKGGLTYGFFGDRGFEDAMTAAEAIPRVPARVPPNLAYADFEWAGTAPTIHPWLARATFVTNTVRLANALEAGAFEIAQDEEMVAALDRALERQEEVRAEDEEAWAQRLTEDLVELD